jgi:hypothetical protein
MEAPVARTDLAQRAVMLHEWLTPPNHSSSAFASLAQSAERIAIAYDDGYGERMTRITMFARANGGALQPLIEAGMWANTSSASIAYSPELREWATFSASNEHVWSVRLRAVGTLIADSGMHLPALHYDRRSGERFLGNGSAWIALAHRDDGTFVFVERGAQRDHVRTLGRRPVQ